MLNKPFIRCLNNAQACSAIQGSAACQSSADHMWWKFTPADGDGNINCKCRLWSENWGRHLLQKWVKMKNAVLHSPPAHLNPTRQINQLFRGRVLVWGSRPRREAEPVLRHRSHRPVGAFRRSEEQYCFKIMPKQLGFGVALKDEAVRCSLSEAICLFVWAASLMRCVLVKMLLRSLMFDEGAWFRSSTGS